MLIAGNWKLNCNIDEAKDLSTSILNILRDKDLNSEVALFPPNIYIDTVKNIVSNSNIFIGAQDCSIHISGAYTGQYLMKKARRLLEIFLLMNLSILKLFLSLKIHILMRCTKL